MKDIVWSITKRGFVFWTTRKELKSLCQGLSFTKNTSSHKSGNLVGAHIFFPFHFFLPSISSKTRIFLIKMNCTLILRLKIIYSKTIRNNLPREAVESHPWSYLKDVYLWHLGTWFGGELASVRFMIALNDVKGLFQLKLFYILLF